MEDQSAQDALREAVDAVYAVAPADFVATRKEWVGRVRAAGHRETAKEVGALRKPSVSAAAINALVRAEDPVLDRLRDIGTRLRHAQSAMDAAGMTALRGERDALLTEWVAAARRHTSGPLAAGTEAEVRDTAVAALADAHASDIVLSGSLTRSLAYSGFGEVDVAGAVARTSTGVVLTRIEGGTRKPQDDTSAHEVAAGPEDTSEVGSQDAHEAEVERLREEVESAEEMVSTARQARRATDAVIRRRQQDVHIAGAGVEQARRLLAQAEHHAAAAQDGLDRAQEEQRDADRTLKDAHRTRDTARRRLEEAQDAS